MYTMKMILLVMSALLVCTNLWLARNCPHLKSPVVACRMWYKRTIECNFMSAILWLLYGASLCLQLFTEVHPLIDFVLSGVQLTLMFLNILVIVYGRYCCKKAYRIRMTELRIPESQQ
jgi:hypothetical protein